MTQQPYSQSVDPLFAKSLDVINRLVRKPPHPEVLYHYTLPEAALAIIERGVLRASNVRFMNDPSEIRYASEVVAGVVREFQPGLSETASRLLGHVANIVERTIEKVDFYVASLSAEGDLLGQWRAYCLSGRGFSLGYRGAPLTRLNNDVALLRVTYDRKEQEAAARDILNIYLPSFAAAVDSGDRERGVAAGAALGVPLTLLLLSFKHHAYEEEREFRLVRFAINSIPLGAVQFRATASMLVPFIEFNLADHQGNTNDKAPLADIVIGPSLDSSRAEKTLKMLLAKCGYSASIRGSTVPFVG